MIHNKFKLFLISISCMIIILLSACNVFKLSGNDQILANTDAQVDSGLEQRNMPITGLWVNETGDNAIPDQFIMITDSSFYWLQVQEQTVREEFSDIVSLDMASGHMQVRMRWIRINGQQMGFDSPTYNLSFVQEGDTLRITDGTGTSGRQETTYPDIPDETFPSFHRK